MHIDDDTLLSQAVAHHLEQGGYLVESVSSGEHGLERFAAFAPDLVILNVRMPGIDGWEACRRLRALSTVPIIFLTAHGDECDQVKGLRMGADDYMTKPFSHMELEARIEAVLRRANMQPPNKSDLLYEDGRLRLETTAQQVYLDGRPLKLTLTERRLLFTLARHASQAMSVEEILVQVWGPEYEDQLDYVKLYVWRLRRKLERDPNQPTYIQTVRGYGYRFMPVCAEESPPERAGAAVAG